MRDEPYPDESEPARHADPVEVAREIALRALTSRARSRQELAAVLARKRVPAEAAAQVLDRLSEVGLINDREFAELWSAGRRRRHISTRVLRDELGSKGVDPELVAEVVGALPEDSDLASALALVARRQRSVAGLEPQVRYRRLAGMLARRGFSGSVIATALRRSDAGLDPAQEED